MAAPARPASEYLAGLPEADPARIEFFEIARRLECLHADQPRLGEAARPAYERVRFGQEPTVAFPPSSIASLSKDEDTKRLHVLLYCFGLLGPNAPMPLHITEYVRERAYNHRDKTLQAFCDIFNHRMSMLLFRAWASCRPTVNRDRPGNDRFQHLAGSLVGLGADSLCDRDSVPDDAKRFHMSSVGQSTRPAIGLATILSDDFGVPVKIEPFMGQWLRFPARNRCILGDSVDTGTLGENIFVGERLWDCQAKFRIMMGPLSLEDFRALLPGTKRFARLRDWIRGYLGRVLSWEVQLILKKGDVPSLVVGSDSEIMTDTLTVTLPEPAEAPGAPAESASAAGAEARGPEPPVEAGAAAAGGESDVAKRASAKATADDDEGGTGEPATTDDSPAEPIAIDVPADLREAASGRALTIDGVPAGSKLSSGVSLGEGRWKVASFGLENLQIVPPAGLSGPIELALSVGDDGPSATVAVTAGGPAAPARAGEGAPTGSPDADVATPADRADEQVTPTPVSASVDRNGAGARADHAAGATNGAPRPIALDLGSLRSELARAESLSISGVPRGARLSAGSDLGDGRWTVKPAEAGKLAITPPPGLSGSFDLSVSSTATAPASGGPTYLGWTTWVNTRTPDEDADHAVFDSGDP